MDARLLRADNVALDNQSISICLIYRRTRAIAAERGDQVEPQLRNAGAVRRVRFERISRIFHASFLTVQVTATRPRGPN